MPSSSYLFAATASCRGAERQCCCVVQYQCARASISAAAHAHLGLPAPPCMQPSLQGAPGEPPLQRSFPSGFEGVIWSFLDVPTTPEIATYCCTSVPGSCHFSSTQTVWCGVPVWCGVVPASGPHKQLNMQCLLKACMCKSPEGGEEPQREHKSGVALLKTAGVSQLETA